MIARHCCSALALLAMLVAPARAADYYVKNGGSDGQDGLSVPTAWATLQHAADGVEPRRHGARARRQLPRLLPLPLRARPAIRSPSPPRAPPCPITADNGTTPDGINVEGAALRGDRRLHRRQPHPRRHPRRRLAVRHRAQLPHRLQRHTGASSAASPTTSPSRTTRRTTRSPSTASTSPTAATARSSAATWCTTTMPTAST